jgi:uncharacterized coiled-coil protein SlyX
MDDRLVELEIKVAYLERTVSELEAALRHQSDEVETLRREVARQRGALSEALESPVPVEKPPHY